MPTWLTALWALIQLVASWFRQAHDAGQQQIGRDQAKSEALEEQARALNRAKEIEEQAAKDHQAKPGDEAFDPEMWRD